MKTMKRLSYIGVVALLFASVAPAQNKLSSYGELTAPADADLLYSVDVSDTSMAETGTTKKLTAGVLRDWVVDGLTLADLGLTATAVEINYVDGVTSAIQTQLDGKQGVLPLGDDDGGIYTSGGGAVQYVNPGTDGYILYANGAGNAPSWGSLEVSLSSQVTGLLGFSHISNGDALSVLGRSANSSGVMASIAAGTDGYVLRRSGTTLGFGQLAIGAFADGIITPAKMNNGNLLSVLGRSAGTNGARADIIAVSDHEVLRRSGTTVGFGAVNLAQSTAVTGLLADANISSASTWNGKMGGTLGSVANTVPLANGTGGVTLKSSNITHDGENFTMDSAGSANLILDNATGSSRVIFNENGSFKSQIDSFGGSLYHRAGSGQIIYATNATSERMFLRNDGRVHINTTYTIEPPHKFGVLGDSAVYQNLVGNEIYEAIVVDYSGNIGRVRPTVGTSGGTARPLEHHTTTTGVRFMSGSGTPEGAVDAPIGTLYTRTDGGAATTLYVKESGSGNTGWVAK